MKYVIDRPTYTDELGIESVVSAVMSLLAHGRLDYELVEKMCVFGFSIHSLSGCRLEDVCVDAYRFEQAFRACFTPVYAHNSPERMTKAAAEEGGCVGREGEGGCWGDG